MAKRRFDRRDFRAIAEYVHEEKSRRKGNRKHSEAVWKEIDRQLDMRPDVSHKSGPTGATDPRKAWLPEVELPLQAEALETLTADTRGMLFPDSGPWFESRAAMTDEYLERADLSSVITGDENDIPSLMTQDNADKLVAGVVDHWHAQYDFRGHVDLINAEAFSYGVGVGRARVVHRRVLAETANGLKVQDVRVPALVPLSIKNTYLDDRRHIVMHEGFETAPLTIMSRKMVFADFKEMVSSGSADGGWITSEIKDLEPDDRGMIELLEAEGDFIVPRKTTDDVQLPGANVWVACGANDIALVRLTFPKHPRTVIEFPYHRERTGTPYATSPLIKGYPLQRAAVEALTYLIEAGALNALPPVSYDRSDTHFAAMGGPVMEPGAMWGTLGVVQPHLVGDPRSLLALYQHFLLQYADAVGIHRARLGAQTVSHTTAFAKNAELQRGAVRTVDYVRASLQGPLTQWLNLAWSMGLQAMGRREMTLYVEPYRGHVTLTRTLLPDLVSFKAHGSGGPAEEQAKRAERMAALGEAIQIDNLRLARGEQPLLNLEAMIEERLRQGGWVDIDPFINRETGAAPDVGGDVGALAALQAAGGLPDGG